VALFWLLLGQQTARAEDESARQHFDAGVMASEESRWEQAAAEFEASLAEKDRPATRFNLILAYHQLQRPLDVLRHALPFLAAPNAAGREEARDQAAVLLADARRKLAVLSVAALPVGSELQVDGHAPAVLQDERVFVSPGVHQLELRLGHVHETIEIELSAGQELPWPRLGRSAPAATSPLQLPVGPAIAPVLSVPTSVRSQDSSLRLIRKRSAWAMGTVGAALALAGGACWLLADRRSDRLGHGGIMRAQEPGYYDVLERYWTSFEAVMPLAFAGGALMASAILVGGQITRRGSLAWSIASIATGTVLLGFGGYWLGREPRPVIPTTLIDRPSRQGGSLLVSTAMPLLTYGVAFPLVRGRTTRLSAGLSTLRVVW
jgi:hypothetical protein